MIKYTACENGVTYGRNCEGNCSNRHCRNTSSPCAVQTGSCRVDRCEAGWRGTDCVETCSNGVLYGRNCEGNCSNRHCLNSSPPCDVQTGSCGVERCQAGWNGTDCTQGCEERVSYGRNCGKECSKRHCLNSTYPCDVQTGSCGTDKCEFGWIGDDCYNACVSGTTYGRNCEGICSNRHCLNPSASCDVQTGSCGVEGCQAGWNGTDCTLGCILGGKYGKNCEGNCSNRQCLNPSASCDVQTGSCGVDRCQPGWMEQDCTKVSDLFQSPSSSIGSGGWAAVGGVIGAVITLIIITGVIVSLLRRGRLIWMKQPGSGKAESSTEMSSVVRDADQSQSSSRHVYNNDYDVMNSDTMAGDKMYDVIKDKHYENI